MKLTWDEWHSFLLGFFSLATGQKFCQEIKTSESLIKEEPWYYGFGRFLAIQYIIVLTYVMIRSIV